MKRLTDARNRNPNCELFPLLILQIANVSICRSHIRPHLDRCNLVQFLKNYTFYKMFIKYGGTIASFAQILIFEKPKLAHEYTTFLMFLL
jgi:hypothetical protein